MLFFALLACNNANEETGAGAPEKTDEVFDLGSAAVTIDVRQAFDAALPVTLLRTDDGAERVVARGTTGEPIEVGVGDVEVQVGPYRFDTASGIDYYSQEDGVTNDGLPMIINADRRYVLQPTIIDVDQATEEVDTTFVGVVGEGTYKCTWRSYELDEDHFLKLGAPITDLETELANAEPPIVGDSIIGSIDLVDGRTLVPDPTSPLANYGGIMQPEDRLIIEATPHGRYPSNIALESPIGNEILPLEEVEGTGVKGQGLNNFEVYYVDRRAQKTTFLYCWYDWTTFANEYYESQQ